VCRSQTELLLRSARWNAARHPRPANESDRDAVRSTRGGYGGKTINTLRLWAASAPDFFDFQAFSHGDFVGAVAETLEAESLTRVLYPDDSTSMGQGLRFGAGIFSRCVLASRFGAAFPAHERGLEGISRESRYSA